MVYRLAAVTRGREAGTALSVGPGLVPADCDTCHQHRNQIEVANRMMAVTHSRESRSETCCTSWLALLTVQWADQVHAMRCSPRHTPLCLCKQHRHNGVCLWRVGLSYSRTEFRSGPCNVLLALCSVWLEHRSQLQQGKFEHGIRCCNRAKHLMQSLVHLCTLR